MYFNLIYNEKIAIFMDKIRSQTEPNIGGIHVSYKSLDLRNSQTTFLGSINKDFANRKNGYSGSKSKYTLVDSLSPRNEKFIFFKTGSKSFGDLIEEFKSSNVELLYVLLLVTLISMMVGFVSLSSIVNWMLSWIPLYMWWFYSIIMEFWCRISWIMFLINWFCRCIFCFKN